MFGNSVTEGVHVDSEYSQVLGEILCSMLKVVERECVPTSSL